MRTSRFGQLLLVVGGAVGVAAVIGLVVGFEPAKLPAALLNIAVYKLTFAAAAGLLAAGAVVRRYAQRADSSQSDGRHEPVRSATRDMLGEGNVADRLSADPTRRKEGARRPPQ